TELLAGDLSTFGVAAPLRLPVRAIDVDGLPEPVVEGTRARCLSDVAEQRAAGRPFLLCAALEALLQPAPAPEALQGGFRSLAVGERHAMSDLLAACLEAGLRRVPVVLAPGEVSLRGDVLDVFPLAASEAVRLEFFDDELESIRTFDPATQRSLGARDSVELRLGSTQGSRTGHVLPHVFT